MAKTKKSTKKTEPRPAKSYLTKRRLASAARKGIRLAAAKTMMVMGYTIVAHKGWVVKKYADGRIEKISALAKKEKNSSISLD